LNVGNPKEAVAKVNGWISDKTNKLITDMVDETMIRPDTLLLLVNAIYFKADWCKQFKPDDTCPWDWFGNGRGSGATKKTDFMRLTHNQYYRNYSDSVMVGIPYVRTQNMDP